MMKNLQKLGRAMMIPVSCLPICGLLMGLGYLLCPVSMQGGTVTGVVPTIGFFLVKAGGAIIDHMAILFAVGVGAGLSERNDGIGCIAALVSWLMMTVLLSPDVVKILNPAAADDAGKMLAFSKIENPFMGILAGLIGAFCYNRFRNTQLPQWLSFFNGKRSVAIVAGTVSIFVAAVMMVVWPMIFGGLVAVGNGIVQLGPIGTVLYAFLNRRLIPFGLHHALNNVIWFDTIGIGDLTSFWAGKTSADVGWSLGMYMSGYFPCMMFGIPGAALAIIRSAKPEHRKRTMGIMLSSAVCAFVCGVTEPFEFAFMFLSPVLYGIYALLYGAFSWLTTVTGFRAGFSFSAGLTDLIFSASLPAAQKTWLILPLGALAFILFYGVFRLAIHRWHLKMPGQEEAGETQESAAVGPGEKNGSFRQIAETVLQGLGGVENICSVDHCITRLRLEVERTELIDREMIRSAGSQGVIISGKNTAQVVIGTSVQFVAEELNRLIREQQAAPAARPVSWAGEWALQPVRGRVIPLEAIPDETFSKGMLGEGYGIEPAEGLVKAPFDGTVIATVESGHAVGLETDDLEILIHVGIDTVNMKGEGFECLVREGETVKAGQPLIRFDRGKIRNAGYSDVVAVVKTN